MTIVIPRFVVFDSSTLGKVSRDFWNRDATKHNAARDFVTRLEEMNVFVTFTTTHLSELLRHKDDNLVLDRLRFLKRLPLIAWLQPYRDIWFPGNFVDLLLRELHSVVHDQKRDWESIVENVRKNIWQSGTGSEMFVDDDFLWQTVRRESQSQHQLEQQVASIARTDPGQIKEFTIGEMRGYEYRLKANQAKYLAEFHGIMISQLAQHGDRRLSDPGEVAASFVADMLKRVENHEEAGGDPLEQIFKFYGIPADAVSDDMTISELGRFAVYIRQLMLLEESLIPRVPVSVKDVPPDALPSYVLEQRLVQVQRGALRVSGSDMGDGFIAPLLLYADSVEVDKRTYEFLTQVKRASPEIGALFKHFFRSPDDYSVIPDRIAQAE